MADKYTAGEEGTAIASWAATGVSLDTEMPNSYIKNELELAKPAHVAGREGGAPAAAARAADDGGDGAPAAARPRRKAGKGKGKAKGFRLRKPAAAGPADVEEEDFLAAAEETEEAKGAIGADAGAWNAYVCTVGGDGGDGDGVGGGGGDSANI